jgi:hypothetical protein
MTYCGFSCEPDLLMLIDASTLRKGAFLTKPSSTYTTDVVVYVLYHVSHAPELEANGQILKANISSSPVALFVLVDLVDCDRGVVPGGPITVAHVGTGDVPTTKQQKSVPPSTCGLAQTWLLREFSVETWRRSSSTGRADQVLCVRFDRQMFKAAFWHMETLSGKKVRTPLKSRTRGVMTS